MHKKFSFIIVSLLCIRSFAQCDSTKLPVVFIHGFLASGDTWAGQIQRFIQAGYCGNQLFVFDWNSIDGNAKKTDSLLEGFIDDVLQRTNAKQIELVGHSAGGGLGRAFLMDSANAAKVARYVHIGSRKWFYEYNWFPNNRCLNIYSSADMIMGKMSGDTEGANNLNLEDKDHYQVATSTETFAAMYSFFNNGKEAVFKNGKTKICYVSGKAVQLGSNEPLVKARVEVYALHSKNGRRKTEKPFAAHVFITDTAGAWGPFMADTSLNYEIALMPADSTVKSISYYYEPFKLSNIQVYLRSLPVQGMIASMLGRLPQNDDESTLAIYSSSAAIIAGRDSITVNTIPVCTPELTPASKTAISSFIYDDGDRKSSGKALKQYSVAPFLNGVDIYLPVSKKRSHTIYFNGRKMNVPAVSSNKRILLAVFN